MNSGDIFDRNDIKVHGQSDPSSSFSNLPIDHPQENCSLLQGDVEERNENLQSTLKKILQELPNTERSIDRTSFGHRTARSREISARSNVEGNDDREERNQITFDLEENLSRASSYRSQGARARRRAKIRSEILEEIDKSLAATRSSLNDFLNLVDASDEERKSTERSVSDSVESLISNKIEDSGKDLSMIRRQSSFISGSITSRSYYRDDCEEKEKNRLVTRHTKSASKEDRREDVKSNNNGLLKNRIVLHPLKFRGYRPQKNIFLNDHDSNDESTPAMNNIRTSEESIKNSSTLSGRKCDHRSLSSSRSLQGTFESETSVERDSKDIDKCCSVDDNVDTYIGRVDRSFEKNFNEEGNVREKDSRSVSTTPNTTLMDDGTDEQKFETDVENGDRTNWSSRTPRKKYCRSIDEPSTLPKRHKGHYSCPCSGRYTLERENCPSSTKVTNDDHDQKTPSFLNMRLMENLETLDTSDNERQDNVANVPALPLDSMDDSRSTSAGSKMYNQNRSLDRNALTKALSNVTSNSRHQESSSTRFRRGSCEDNEKVGTFESGSSDKIAISCRTWQPQGSIGSRDLRESYDEVDVTRQSRRAFSAPCQQLSGEKSTSSRDDESGRTSDVKTFGKNVPRCKSADFLQGGVCPKTNFLQSLDSSCSSHLVGSIGTLSYVDDYQTFNEPIETPYSRDDVFDIANYGIPCMYPRQSHLSVLQEESETRLEENDRSESIIANKNPPVADPINENVDKTDANEKTSAASSNREENANSLKIEEKRSSSENENELDDNKTNGSIQSYDKNNENNDDSSKNHSPTDTRESRTISTSSRSRISKSNSDTNYVDWNNENEKTKDDYQEGDNEFQADKSYDETIVPNDYPSEIMYDKVNGPEGMALENARLQFLTSVRPETAIFVIQNIQETRTVPPKISCSTPRLQRSSEGTKLSPGFKTKKSQDRFPFTISTSNKQQDRCDNVANKTRSLEIFRNFNNPFFMKEFMEIPRENVECLNSSEQQQEQRDLVPRMKGLVRKFSKKFKITRKRNDLEVSDDPTTRVIYQNDECQVDSMPETCSDDSSIKESEWVMSRSANTRSSIISSGKSLKKSMSLENLTLCTEYPRRRYDRDDLWVKELQERSPGRQSEKKSSKERFSLFPSKSSNSSHQEDSKRSRRSSRSKDCVTWKKDDQIENPTPSLVSNLNESTVDFKKGKEEEQLAEEKENGVESGCLCLKLFQTITCSLFVRSHGGGSTLIDSNQNRKAKKKKKKNSKRSTLKRRKG